MLQSNHQSYEPVSVELNDIPADEESMTFTAMSSSQQQPNQQTMYSNQPAPGAAPGQPLQLNPNPNFNPNNTQLPDNNNNELQLEVITAIPIPNTIRPPKIRKAVHPSIIFVKKLSILLIGFFLAFISYLDSFIFLNINYMHRATFTIAATLWGLGAFSLVVGAIWGAVKGQWRMLAPGIVLNHAAGFIIRMVI